MGAITQELVKEIFIYDPYTGLVTHRTNKTKARIGDRAGSSSKSCSRYLRIFGKKELEHRIIWLYVYGVFPENEVDHINHDRGDNRLSNLREVTHQINMRNQPRHYNNTTGTTGVSIDARCGKYRAYLNIDGKPKGLGYYTHYEDAVAARKNAMIAEGGYHANHGR